MVFGLTIQTGLEQINDFNIHLDLVNYQTDQGRTIFSSVCWHRVEGKVKEEKEDLAHHNRKDSLGNFLNLTFSKSRYWRM